MTNKRMKIQRNASITEINCETCSWHKSYNCNNPSDLKKIMQKEFSICSIVYVPECCPLKGKTMTVAIKELREIIVFD